MLVDNVPHGRHRWCTLLFIGGHWAPPLISNELQWLASGLVGVSSSGHITGKLRHAIWWDINDTSSLHDAVPECVCVNSCLPRFFSCSRSSIPNIVAFMKVCWQSGHQCPDEKKQIFREAKQNWQYICCVLSNTLPIEYCAWIYYIHSNFIYKSAFTVK